MIPTAAELEALLSDLESDLAERKSSAGDRSAIRRTICAYANDRQVTAGPASYSLARKTTEAARIFRLPIS